MSRTSYFIRGLRGACTSLCKNIGPTHKMTYGTNCNQDLYFCKKISARRGSNPRPSPWQGDAPPLSHSRIITCVTHNASKTIPHCYFSVNIFINSFFAYFSFFSLIPVYVTFGCLTCIYPRFII